MIFITHDLGVIAEIADDVAVMYRGNIVEHSDVLSIFSKLQASIYKEPVVMPPNT